MAEVMTKARILVVEDDIYLMEGIRDILELDGYTVITADSGQSGLSTLQSTQELPDLIVSDIMMPVMDGYEFLNAVRSDARWLNLPFIFLTAKGERADENLGKELGADDYVTKPFGPDDLLVAVSSKLRRHRQLQQLHTQQVEDIKRQIMTILYHEFNTPLTYMVAYNELLNTNDPNGLSSDMLRSFLAGVNSGATRLRRLVENFILLVELETGEAEESFLLHKHEITDIKTIITPLVEEFRYELETQKHQLHLEIADNLPPITGHELYIYKSIRCLLENAMKFSKANTNVYFEVGLHVDNQHICIAIRDEGRGIAEEEFEKIFEPFYQINRKQNEDQGSGAGLTIAHRVAKLHGGNILVESKLKEGSTFKMLLPINS